MMNALEQIISIGLESMKGHKEAKRVLKIAAAGGHHVLLNGPPGCGKTMLADAFHTILSDLYVTSTDGIRRSNNPSCPANRHVPLFFFLHRCNKSVSIWILRIKRAILYMYTATSESLPIKSIRSVTRSNGFHLKFNKRRSHRTNDK